MERKVFLGWLRVNAALFSGAFAAGLASALLFPDTMMGFVRAWGAYSIAAGPWIAGRSTKEVIFASVLAKNGMMTVLYFAASLLLLSPVLAAMGGCFYSLGLMSALERGLVPYWHSPILISIEASFILLAITFASALGSEVFGVKPGMREAAGFWKGNWRRLVPRKERGWKGVLGGNARELALFAVAASALLLLGAWFEAFVIASASP